MGDYANTILLAWPYPGHGRLSATVRDHLALAGQLPLTDSPIDASDLHREDRAVILAGDAETGPILQISDTEADGGVEHYRDTIKALTGAGMSVYAANRSGWEYGAAAEYHRPAGAGETSPVERRLVRGCVIAIDGDQLLEATGSANLADIADSVLADLTRTLLSHPPALPAAIVALAFESGATNTPRRDG